MTSFPISKDNKIIKKVKEVNLLTINPLQYRRQHYHDVEEWFFIIKGQGILIHHR